VWDWVEGVGFGFTIFILALSLLGLRDFVVAHGIAGADVSSRKFIHYYHHKFYLLCTAANIAAPGNNG
jgi:hypothetical protein